MTCAPDHKQNKEHLDSYDAGPTLKRRRDHVYRAACRSDREPAFIGTWKRRWNEYKLRRAGLPRSIAMAKGKRPAKQRPKVEDICTLTPFPFLESLCISERLASSVRSAAYTYTNDLASSAQRTKFCWSPYGRALGKGTSYVNTGKRLMLSFI